MFVLILYIFLLLGIEWPVYFNQFQLLTVVQQSEEKILPNEKNKKINKYCTTQFLTIHSPYIVIHPLINIMYIYIVLTWQLSSIMESVRMFMICNV